MRTSDLSPNDIKGLRYIRDIILYQSRTPTLQMISDHVGFKSRRAASLLIDRLIAKGYLARTPTGNLRLLREASVENAAERTVPIPLVGSAPCGAPFLAEENIEAMIPVSQRIVRPGGTYFLLRAVGNSMNLAGINDGDLALVRQQQTANEGDRIVALIDDEATIKEFRRRGDKIVLMPRSSEKEHQPIILDRDFSVQGIVIDTIEIPD